MLHSPLIALQDLSSDSESEFFGFDSSESDDDAFFSDEEGDYVEVVQ